ncbi:MAG: HAD family hydrolase [Thermoplasmata archaeon]|nr:HAD family hydrolase [Thermoplasmata archaeon]
MQLNEIISFDLDGTLVTTDFVDAVWLERIPELYAEKYGLDFEEAKKRVEEEYLKVGPEALEWYDIHYWIEKFKLDANWKEILLSCKNKLRLYPEVKKVLENLSENATLIITSNAAREFIEIEVEVLDLRRFFSKIFSAVSDFHKTKKDKEVYRKIMEKVGGKFIHVGDNYEFDYIAPRQAGLVAYYLDRSGNSNGSHVVRNLMEFEEKLAKIF